MTDQRPAKLTKNHHNDVDPTNSSLPRLGRDGEGYAELHTHSYFSLLDGATSPEALVARAVELGLSALALTDHASLAGAIRFFSAARRAQLHPILGAEVTLEDGHHLTLLAESQSGYANLCRLITAARLDQLGRTTHAPFPHQAEEAGLAGPESTAPWPGKVEPALSWARLAEHHAGLICLSGCRRGPLAAPLLQRQPAQALAQAQQLLEIFGPQHLFVELHHHHLPTDAWLTGQLLHLAHQLALPVVATNNVHYALPSGARLHDALIAIRHNQTLTAARQAGHLPLNHTAYLAAPAEMQRRFAGLPQALHNSRLIAQRCQVELDFSHHRLPTFPTPEGSSEFAYLYQLCHTQLPQRYPQLTARVLQQLAHELAIIEHTGLAGYFLIVWDIMRFARTQDIRCQGRGSAANSLVAYLLGITSIDPLHHNLLFERFLSPDKFTMPDIDIDFAAATHRPGLTSGATPAAREAVIQYVYQKYGVTHTAMVCNVVTYQARSAVRDLAKVLGFPTPVIDRLVQKLDTHSCQTAADQVERELASQAEPTEQEIATPSPLVPLSPHPLRLLSALLRHIDGCPRHLSIHSGGMLITAVPLAEIVPSNQPPCPVASSSSGTKTASKMPALSRSTCSPCAPSASSARPSTTSRPTPATPRISTPCPWMTLPSTTFCTRPTPSVLFKSSPAPSSRCCPASSPPPSRRSPSRSPSSALAPSRAVPSTPTCVAAPASNQCAISIPPSNPCWPKPWASCSFRNRPFVWPCRWPVFPPGKPISCVAPSPAKMPPPPCPPWPSALSTAPRPTASIQSPPRPSSPSWPALPAMAFARATP